MGIYNAKYATSEQIAEIEQLAIDGHRDAIIAFGADCVDGFKKDLARNCLIAFGIGVFVAAADSVVKAIKKKRKEKKLRENSESE